MNNPEHSPSSGINTPDELLANAEWHYSSSDINAMRAAVLEAMAALETFVQKKVFNSLEGKLDPDFVDWLEKKTRMDFDSRLSTLTQVALGRPIASKGTLWTNYKRARDIRNRVVHAGTRVSRKDARFVIDTVCEWLAFLGSSVNVQVALLGLKNFFARHRGPSIRSERDAIELIVKYFSKSKATKISKEERSTQSRIQPDVVLNFGSYMVIIEAKFSEGNRISGFISEVTKQLSRMVSEFEAAIGAVVLFHQGEVEPAYRNILVLEEGKLYLLVIPV